MCAFCYDKKRLKISEQIHQVASENKCCNYQIFNFVVNDKFQIKFQNKNHLYQKHWKIKFLPNFAQCYISKHLENIRKPKLSLYFHGVKKHIIVLNWFKGDESNIYFFIPIIYKYTSLTRRDIQNIWIYTNMPT